MAKDIVKHLSRPGSPIILAVLTQGAGTQFQGEPLQKRCKIHGGEKILRFSTEIAIISEMERDRPMAAMER